MAEIIGRVREIVRYPVKSMAGIPVESAHLGFHGIDGDRRFAFRRVGDTSAFPFLTASRCPQLITYHPIGEPLPTHVRSPSGSEVELRGDALRSEITRLSGHDVELMMFKNGIFDDSPVSIISTTTIAAIGREAGLELDRRRMRANILLDTEHGDAFLEDAWVGARMFFGEEEQAPAVSIASCDERCVMVNLDPDTAVQDPRVMKAVVRMNRNYAGVYAAVIRSGTIHVGQTVRLLN